MTVHANSVPQLFHIIAGNVGALGKVVADQLQQYGGTKSG
jgi:hypothetical protein